MRVRYNLQLTQLKIYIYQYLVRFSSVIIELNCINTNTIYKYKVKDKT